MKLFHSPASCSLSPAIALFEAGLPVELVKVDLRSKTTEHGADYRVINPLGYVPALQLDDGEILVEGPAIVQFIADLAPASGLAPANGTRERYRLQSALAFINSELHKGIGVLFAPGLSDEEKAGMTKRIRYRLDQHEAQWGERTWFLGDGFTVADGYQFVVLNWLQFVGMDLADWPKLTAHSARVRARPAVQAAMKAVGLG
ncbi:glutathione S-transferase N-terminal domain-containing protein [Silanimonas sp.]|uniref:glutathione S-transferase N-terminal domain-containing protein n=1 Tax=Silanimonas sp. TaxID=1929290 RepID=UPI0022C4EE57|nr:glutathione S-transferase N-terminal domain-containing protein [Silanimonas sp.]MCZ8165099.1 glutathione S-transferase N-terminal domain-containing protein [Silanimonas sp.]